MWGLLIAIFLCFGACIASCFLWPVEEELMEAQKTAKVVPEPVSSTEGAGSGSGSGAAEEGVSDEVEAFTEVVEVAEVAAQSVPVD